MVLLGDYFLGNWHCSSCLKSFHPKRQVYRQGVGGKKDKRNDGKRKLVLSINSIPYNRMHADHQARAVLASVKV
jgi:hypothetical protein